MFHTRMMISAAFVFASLAAPALGAPVRTMLGQYPLPSVDDPLKSFQSGFFRVGHFIKNDAAAASARPDSSGSAYNLYQFFIHDGVRGSRLGFAADALFLSDRERKNNFSFTQLNYLLGVVFKNPNGARLQFDREESLGLDRGGLGWRYWDARMTLEAESASSSKQRDTPANRLAGRSPGGALGAARGSVTAAYFLHNNTFPARADLGGLAALRYVARGEVEAAGAPVKLLAEADFLTEEHRALHPVNMDLSYGLAFGLHGFETALLRKTSRVLDRKGHFSHYLLTVSYPFGRIE